MQYILTEDEYKEITKLNKELKQLKDVVSILSNPIRTSERYCPINMTTMVTFEYYRDGIQALNLRLNNS